MEQGQTLKILMLEDNDDDVELIVRILQKEKFRFQHQRVETKEEFHQAIDGFIPDIVLSDNGLPGFNSLDALKVCLRPQTATPFILVAGAISDELVNCLRQGADDYVLKSNLTKLPTAILKAVEKHKEHHKRVARKKWIVTMWRRLVRKFFKTPPKFKVNQAVQHISGGPLMVVSGFNYDGHDELYIICQWYERDQRTTLRQEFPEHELKAFNWNNPSQE